ncbi:MAG: hypothetical protein LBP79_04965 [Clostridiales bacterium]|jgi:hypothetical protein|nr:hypothetical protein [Clostridiales bacterium]
MLHALCDNVSLFCDYPKIRKGILDKFFLIIDKVNLLGARHIIFHTGDCPHFKKSGYRHDEFASRFSEHYAEIVQTNIEEFISRA